MVDASIVTFDIDWADDTVINYCIDLMLDQKIPSTWFATHPSKCLDRLRLYPDLFEIGIHPNFLSGSSHGDNYESVLRYCMDIVPEAVSMRSHTIYHNGRVLTEAARLTPIRFESNAFLPMVNNCQPVRQNTRYYDFLRVPFVWTDDYELAQSTPNWQGGRFKERDGLSVYIFHPIHVFLNSEHEDTYAKSKNIDPMDLPSIRYDGLGAKTMLLDIIASAKHNFIRMKDLGV